MSYVVAGHYRKTPNETVDLGIGFGALLASGEALTGTPTVSIGPGGGNAPHLQKASVQINTTAAFTDKDGANSIAQNEGVIATYSGGVDGQTYTVTAQATNDTTSEVHEVVIHVTIDSGVVR